MKKDELIKPITLVAEDFKNSLFDLANNSKLPFIIIESIIKDFLNEVHNASQKQLEADQIAYQKRLEEQEVNTKKT